MISNPLQKYFRQPKFYISLPSKGAYTTPGTVNGDVTKLPIYGMTGVDEIIVKTPDALLSGESTVSVIQSCCPAIKDAWQIPVLDTDIILTAIKIASYGNNMPVTHICENEECGEDNDYDIDLTKVIDHFNECQYINKVVVGDLTIKLKPLSYKQFSEIGIENFKLQQRLSHVTKLTDEIEQQTQIDQLWKEIAQIQNSVLVKSIDSVETPESAVTERKFIEEWFHNCDREIVEAIKKQIATNKEMWSVPTFPVKCASCGTTANLKISLDSSVFFGKA
jgi:hypothetical protein